MTAPRDGEVTFTFPVDMARYLAGFLTAVFAEERRQQTLDSWVEDLIDALAHNPIEPGDQYRVEGTDDSA